MTGCWSGVAGRGQGPWRGRKSWPFGGWRSRFHPSGPMHDPARQRRAGHGSVPRRRPPPPRQPGPGRRAGRQGRARRTRHHRPAHQSRPALRPRGCCRRGDRPADLSQCPRLPRPVRIPAPLRQIHQRARRAPGRVHQLLAQISGLENGKPPTATTRNNSPSSTRPASSAPHTYGTPSSTTPR